MLNRNPAIVSGHAYDPYGRLLMRERAGRGDLDNDTGIRLRPGNESDRMGVAHAAGGTVRDPRGDLDKDGATMGTFDSFHAQWRRATCGGVWKSRMSPFSARNRRDPS